MKVKKLSVDSKVPTRGTPGSAGYDLYSLESTEIPAGSQTTVRTGIAIQIKPGTYARIAEKSSLASKKISIGGGVIDSDYRGELLVIMRNHDSVVDFEIQKGMKIAQLIIEVITLPDVEVVESLDSTVRDGGGFGSTGRF